MSSNKLISEKIEFPIDGDIIRGTLYLPSNHTTNELPGVVLAHGWAMTAGGDLEDYAQTIAQHNIICLTIDFRNLGASTGQPRQHLDPNQQIEDLRSAIDYLQQRPEVDSERIGLWGSSYAGGHVISVSGIDPRVKVAVSQVPTISGYKAKQEILTKDELLERAQRFTQARLSREHGIDTEIIKTVSNEGQPCAYSDFASYSYMSKQAKRCPNWQNFTTVASLDLAQTYEPGSYVYRIEDTAFMMIIASDDKTTPTNLQQEAFENIPSANKELVTVPGGHYSVYEDFFDETNQKAAEWFIKHL